MKRQSGFTLTEVLVSVGLLSILGLVIAKVTTDTRSAQMTIEDKNEYNQFITTLEEFIRTDDKCESALSGRVLLPPVGNNPGPENNISLPNFWRPTAPNQMPRLGLAAGNTRLIAGPATSPRIRLTGLTLQTKGVPAIPVTLQVTTNPGPPPQTQLRTYNRLFAQITVRAEQNNGSGGFFPLPSKVIDIPLYTNPATNRVEKCLVQIEKNDICQMDGSRFNPATNTCVPNTQCQIKGVYSLPTCSPGYNPCPGGAPNFTTGGYNCPPGATPVETGRYTTAPFEASCGKKCTEWITPTIHLYMCMAC